MSLTSNPRNQPPSYAKCQSDLHAARETIEGYETASYQAMTMLALATATADRLKSCEGLLKEIGEVRYTYDDSRKMDGVEWGVVSLPVAKWRDWTTRIRALLGPTATP